MRVVITGEGVEIKIERDGKQINVVEHGNLSSGLAEKCQSAIDAVEDSHGVEFPQPVDDCEEWEVCEEEISTIEQEPDEEFERQVKSWMIQKMPKHMVEDEDIDQAIADKYKLAYNKQWLYRKLAKEYGVSHQYVMNIIRDIWTIY